MSALRSHFQEMTDIQRELGECIVAARTDPAKKPHVIEKRRQFAKALMAVSVAADTDPQLLADAALAKEFRQRFSAMRTGIAIFQAKWPAVLLGSHDPEFERSANQLRDSNRAFTDWAGHVLNAPPAPATGTARGA